MFKKLGSALIFLTVLMTSKEALAASPPPVTKVNFSNYNAYEDRTYYDEDGSYDITWSTGVWPENKYLVRFELWEQYNGGPWKKITWIDRRGNTQEYLFHDDTHYSVRNREFGRYRYKVKGCYYYSYGIGCESDGATSDVIEVTEPPKPPEAPIEFQLYIPDVGFVHNVENGFYVANSSLVQLYWRDGYDETYYSFRSRPVGSADWQVETLTASIQTVYRYDFDRYEFEVAACNDADCSDYTALNYPVYFDLAEVEAQDPLSIFYFLVKPQNGNAEAVDYCLADAETNTCPAVYMEVHQQATTYGADTCLYKAEEEIGCVLVDDYSQDYGRIIDLPVGIHTYYVKEYGGSNKLLARKRFHVYLPVTGEVSSSGCEIDSSATDCTASLAWSIDGEYPACLYQIEGVTETELGCLPAGSESDVQSVTLGVSPKQFEVRAQEPAGERMIASSEFKGSYQGVSLTSDPAYCDVHRDDAHCDTRVGWSASNNYSACLFLDNVLQVCSNGGYMDTSLPLGSNSFELRNGPDLSATLLAQQTVNVLYAPSGSFEIQSDALHPCTPAPGTTECDVLVKITHWNVDPTAGYSGATLYKDDIAWGGLGISGNGTSYSDTYTLTAANGGTRWSLRTVKDGKQIVVADIDLLTTTFASEGYALTAETSYCSYNPLESTSCTGRLGWSMPDLDACLFRKDNPSSIYCPPSITGSGEPHVSAGTHIFQLRKGNSIDGDLVAQVAIIAEEERVSTVNVGSEACVIEYEGQPCRVALSIFTNEAGNICLYRDGQRMDAFCGLVREVHIEDFIVEEGMHTYQLVREDANNATTVLAETQVDGVIGYLPETNPGVGGQTGAISIDSIEVHADGTFNIISSSALVSICMENGGSLTVNGGLADEAVSRLLSVGLSLLQAGLDAEIGFVTDDTGCRFSSITGASQ